MPDRRTFLKTALGSGLVLAGGAVACQDKAGEPALSSPRNHPLSGLEREEIKVTDIKVTPLSAELPPDKQWHLSWRTEDLRAWKTDSILVEVFTDAGIKGIGGCTQYGGPAAIADYVTDIIKPAIVGQNPFDIEYLTSGVANRGPMVGWAGVDAAFWDIIGKAKGVPVYKLLAIEGDPPDRVPVYASAGEMLPGDVWPHNLVEEALEMKKRGFKAYKFRPGINWEISGMTMSEYIDGVWKIREAVGPDFDLIQECNALWSMDQVMQFIPEAEKMGLLWIEDPTRRTGPGATENYIKIKETLDRVMLSYGGDVMDNRFDYKEWIDRQAMNIIQPDAGVMGLTETWYVSRMAHLQDVFCAPHNWHGALLTIANASLAASIPNLLLLEVNQTYNPLRTDLLKEPLSIKNGMMELPKGPGFGIEVIDNPGEKFPYIPGHYDEPRPSSTSGRQ